MHERERDRKRDTARQDLPRATRRLKAATGRLRQIPEDEEPTADVLEKHASALREYLDLRRACDPDNRHSISRRRIERLHLGQRYRKDDVRLALTDPSRSNLLSEAIIVPIWRIIETAASHASSIERPSDPEIARAVHEVIVSFLPSGMTSGLTANAIRQRANYHLVKNART